jgi:hypothetical protein
MTRWSNERISLKTTPTCKGLIEIRESPFTQASLILSIERNLENPGTRDGGLRSEIARLDFVTVQP